jgi:fructose-1,6-bisphosphatase/sedoheptulose 1,7-bisphosphatase-like protein
MFPRQHLDLYVGVVRESIAVMAAAIARSCGGECLAIPLVQHPHESYAVAAGSPIVRSNQMVSGDRFFSIITAITPHPLLDGVSLNAEGQANTHTMVANARSGTVRFIKHQRQLWRDHFYAYHGDERVEPASKVYSDFLKDVTTRR